MAKTTEPKRLLLRWSDHVPASDVQDPLGLGLRGSARLASNLLFCVTSITPRARYFSFIPWCVFDFQRRERGRSFSEGLRNAIVFRERALTLGCIAHHNGKPCVGGALVGSERASKWFALNNSVATFAKQPLDFAKIPALAAYFNSLVNLGCFITDEERKDVEDVEGSRQAEFTFDDIELSPLGQDLAEAYDAMIGALPAVEMLSTPKRECSVESLVAWGKRGGLCEVASEESRDRQLLRDVFFARLSTKGPSHQFRKESLLLILELAKQLAPQESPLNNLNFATATYFDAVLGSDGTLTRIDWPDGLRGIATRWRMFYFHYYMGVALEGMLAWLVTRLSDKGVAGGTIAGLTAGLNSKTLSKQLGALLDVEISSKVGEMTPGEVVHLFGVEAPQLSLEASATLDDAIQLDSPLAEPNLEAAIRDQRYLDSDAGLVVPVILLSLTLARFTRWEQTDFGYWLAGQATDAYRDLIPPVVLNGLVHRLGNWWECSLSDITQAVLSRFVVEQHLSMSYERSSSGDRCLLQTDGLDIGATGSYENVGMGNPRLQSAIRILKDLAFLGETEDEVTRITPDGAEILEAEMPAPGAE